MRLKALAPAKVNLGLFVGRVQANGRHRLATIYESVSLADEVVVETLEGGGRSGEGGSGEVGDVVECAGVSGENLASRALASLRAAGWDGPPLKVTIEKRIPVAAGMGGGSADAAAVLRLALAIAPGLVDQATVARVAAGLGADVPGQLEPGVTFGTGEGEIVTRLEPLAEHALVVVPSALALSTPAVYAEHDRLGLGRSSADLERWERELIMVSGRRPAVALAGECLTNDLQRPAVALCPSIADVLADVEAVGAELAFVSGSGPTVLGIWWGEGAVWRAGRAAQLLAERYPAACVANPVGADIWAPVPL